VPGKHRVFWPDVSPSSQPPSARPARIPSVPPDSEQRRYARYSIWFPVTLKEADAAGAGKEVKEVWGICRDLSPKGLMMSSMVILDVGKRVTVVFRLEPDGPQHSVTGRIVRGFRNDDELLLAFPFRIAIEFDAAVAAIEKHLRASEGSP